MRKKSLLDNFVLEVGLRLKAIRESRSLSVNDLSNLLGIKNTSYHKYERGENFPDKSVILALKRNFQINIHWLFTGEGEMILQTGGAADMSNFRPVPVIGQAACGSSGRILDEAIEGYKAFEIRFLKKFHNPCLTRAKGDSMLPMITEGDLLLCDRDVDKRLRPDPRHMYLVDHPDGADEVAIKVKKLSFSGRTLTLIPLNPAYPPIAIDVTGKSILDIVLGQIVWIGRELG
jgi:phage repressor protein C with HTH and peptisase S24 domain